MARSLTRPGASPSLDPTRLASERPAYAGYSLVELMFVAGALAMASAVAVPVITRGLDQFRTRGAARYLASRLQRARAEAVARGANVALCFSRVGARMTFGVFVDGNRNGVLTADIAAGIDHPIAATADLADFTGVQFGLVAGVVAPDGTPLAGDPIRFGLSRMASFTPVGTASAGSVYLRGRDGSQYAVRVYGDTGRTTVWRFEPRGGWVPL